MTTTKRPLPRSLVEQRQQAQRDAIALVKLYDSLNKAASAIGMNRGRLSWISRGSWTNVAVNELDLVMLATGKAIREKDVALTQEARALAAQFQQQLSDLHNTASKLLGVLRRL